MRRPKWAGATAALLALCGVAALAATEPFAGAWSGSWEGGGASGRIELTLSAGANGELAGEASVGQAEGDYVAKLTAVTTEGSTFSARYDYPYDSQSEIALQATFEAAAASGTWALVPKGGDPANAMAGGTWKASRK